MHMRVKVHAGKFYQIRGFDVCQVCIALAERADKMHTSYAHVTGIDREERERES